MLMKPVPSMGLSPLTRGNRLRGEGGNAAMGPIPAHAGEPRVGAVRVAGEGAYPRSRGGTVLDADAIDREMGLSPLTRGNLSYLTH